MAVIDLSSVFFRKKLWDDIESSAPLSLLSPGTYTPTTGALLLSGIRFRIKLINDTDPDLSSD
jgi:hypothetical protein